jgi:hypothetical protein
MRVALLQPPDAAAYRLLMLQAYEGAADAFTSTAQERTAEPLSLWEQDGWLWMDGPTGPQKALTLTVPPLAVATERVPCTVAMFDGVEALWRIIGEYDFEIRLRPEPEFAGTEWAMKSRRSRDLFLGTPANHVRWQQRKTDPWLG